MKKYSSIILALLLIFTISVPASLVGAQSNSDFSEIIQKISSSENLSSQEKEDVMDKTIELHYGDGVSLDQIFEALNQSVSYDDMENQLANLDMDDEDDMNDDGMMDDDDFDDDDMDDDDDMMDDDDFDDEDMDDDDDMMDDDDYDDDDMDDDDDMMDDDDYDDDDDDDEEDED